MKKHLFDDIPGIGEVTYFRRNPFIEQENPWLDDLAFGLLQSRRPLSIAEFERLCGEGLRPKAFEMPFLRIQNSRICFRSGKYHVAATLLPVWEALESGNELRKLQALMPYDFISYFRPVIEASDAERLIQAIEHSSGTPHYVRFVLLLLRRCAVEGNKSWAAWLDEYIARLPEAIDSYPAFTVQRDARVTRASIRDGSGFAALRDFVQRMEEDRQLQEFEIQHFIESCDSAQRTGEILIHKLCEEGYRQEIALVNVFSIRFFPSPRVASVLEAIAGNTALDQEIRRLASGSNEVVRARLS